MKNYKYYNNGVTLKGRAFRLRHIASQYSPAIPNAAAHRIERFPCNIHVSGSKSQK